MNQIEYSGRDNLEVMQEAKNYNKFLLDLIFSSAKNDDVLVDFGAGSGTFSFPLTLAGYRVICVENDPVLFAKLAEHGMTVFNDLEQVADESIDCIYSLNVLEHIEKDDAILSLWYRKLRPGGNVLVYVPAFEILFSEMDRKVGHFRRYNKIELCHKLRNAGFKIIKSRYADSFGFFATIVYKLLNRGDGSVDLNILKFYDRWVFPFSRFFDVVIYGLFGKNVYAMATK